MSAPRFDVALVWFRRDLRDFDHAALHRALAEARRAYCAFVFDREILDALPSRSDRRVHFIRESLVELDAALATRGGGMIVRHGRARDEIVRLASELGATAVYANRDYEPAARERDEAVGRTLATRGIEFVTCKDRVVFEPDELATQAGKPFVVFTPYQRAWLAALTPSHFAPQRCEGLPGVLAAPPAHYARGIPALDAIGFESTNLGATGVEPGMRGGAARVAAFRGRIDEYHRTRDFPAEHGTSGLSVHLRFGTVSIRELAALAHDRSLRPAGHGAAAWLSELIWREFFVQLLWHFPHAEKRAFRPEFAALRFPGAPDHFAAWCEGRTGYPIVDAAMRQLDATGWMHNRLRMIAASFLVKDLLVDWRLGEHHFAEKLLDFDLASNNGGWQWAASTGCDAQPYFRIFNPVTQSRRFDPEGEFIRRHVPEIAKLDADHIHAPWLAPESVQRARGVVVGRDYPAPIVDHAMARRQALAMFEAARSAGGAAGRGDR